MVNLIIENQTANFEATEAQYKEVVESSFEKLEYKSNILIELIFVEPERIQALNCEYRQKDQATDVLSFPQKQFEIKENILGSIVICPKIAEERGEAIEELIKHGLLHLLGYDHEKNETDWDAAAKTIDCFL